MFKAVPDCFRQFPANIAVTLENLIWDFAFFRGNETKESEIENRIFPSPKEKLCFSVVIERKRRTLYFRQLEVLKMNTMSVDILCVTGEKLCF